MEVTQMFVIVFQTQDIFENKIQFTHKKFFEKKYALLSVKYIYHIQKINENVREN